MQRAERDLKAGDYEKAKIEYLNLLRMDHRNSTAIQRLGTIWFENGVPLRAYPYLLTACDLAPENLESRAKLATVLASLGEMAEAQKQAIAVLDVLPTQDEATLALADTIRTEQDVELAEERLWKNQERESAAYHLAWAKIAAWKGDMEWARSELQRALKAEPGSPRPHLAMANFYLAQDNQAEAEREFSMAVQLAPIRSEARLRFAEVQALSGRRDAAKGSLKQITKEVPDYLPAWRLLAQIAFEEKNWDESLALLEKVFDQDLGNIEARLLEANVWLAKGDAAKAVEGLEQLDVAYPNVPLIKYRLARAYLQNNDQPQAEIALSNAIFVDPDYVDALLLLAELNLRTGKAALVAGAMTSLLERQPGLAQAQSLLVEAYQSLGRPQDAVEIVRDQVKLSPRSADAYLRLGIVLSQSKKDAEARQAFEKAAELAPESLTPLNQLVELDIAAKDFASAAKRVQEKLQQAPKSAGVHFLEGRIYFAKGDWGRAEAALLQALDLDPNLSKAYDLLISSYVAAERIPQAINELQSVLSKNPDNERALLTLALIYDTTKDFLKARQVYEKVLSLNPGSTTAMNNLAYIYAEQLHQLDKAYELARKARTLEPVNPAVADTLGWILYRQARYQQALSLIREAAVRLPDAPEIQVHLGLANYMMDQPEPARAAFKKAVSAPADFASKPEARKWLAFLEDDSGAPRQLTIDELEKLLQQRPNDLVARVRLGELYEKQGAIEKAAAAYEAALNVNPKLTEATLRLAQLYAGPLHKLDSALALAKAARDLAPDDPRVAGILGRIAYLTGNFSWAYGLLVESAHGRSEDPGVAYDLAWAAYSLGKVSEAQQAMRRVIELPSDSQQSLAAKRFLALTDLEMTDKDPAASQGEVEKALKADPGYVPALMARAAMEKQQGESKAAIGTYGDVLKRFPDFAPAQKQLAALYLEDPGALDKAYELAVKARKILPDDPELALTLGEISYQRREFAYAIQLFQESDRRKPLLGRDLYYLGISQLRTSQNAESRKTLEQALAAGLQEPFSQEAKAAIDELRKREGL